MRILLMLVSFVVTFVVAVGWQVVSAQNQIEATAVRIEKLFELEQQIYEEETNKALALAPPGKSKYQLRGDAQRRAQEVLNKLTDLYHQPRINLGGIVFRPILSGGAAGRSTSCEQVPRIELSEILFYRNYDEFMRMVIPHEIAHIGVCLKFGDYIDINKDGHDERWESVMRDLGFLNPQNEERHNMNMDPIYEVMRRIRVAITDLSLG